MVFEDQGKSRKEEPTSENALNLGDSDENSVCRIVIDCTNCRIKSAIQLQ
jgi:hypothetical protein